jgi:hypothetical protein
MSVPAIPLNDGNRIPILAFGTGSKFRGKASKPVLSTDLPLTFFLGRDRDCRAST